jgi:tetratricopeptide (TPR) repeat protein
LTKPSFVVQHVDELERFEAEIATIPVRIPLGISSFGINAYAPGPAGHVIEEHDELGHGAGRHEELYFVARGHATFVLGGEEVDAPAGTLVYVGDPAVRRAAISKSDETIVLVVGGVPGQAFRPSPWEAWLEALPYHVRGDTEKAVEIMRAARELHPENPNVLYNLACMESLSGETDAALEHLAQAIEGDPRSLEWAQADSDFDPIREDPRFPRAES